MVLGVMAWSVDDSVYSTEESHVGLGTKVLHVNCPPTTTHRHTFTTDRVSDFLVFHFQCCCEHFQSFCGFCVVFSVSVPVVCSKLFSCIKL